MVALTLFWTISEFAHNKAFKSDSQRLAFLSLCWVLCLWRNGIGQVVALLTP